MTLTLDRTAPGWADAAERVKASVVQLRCLRHGYHVAQGCGIVWSRQSDGSALIVSNAHVVEQNPASLVGAQGREYAPTLVAMDRRRDLSLLSVGVALSDLVPVSRGRRQPLRPGEFVIAVGHPFGLPNAVSAGVVHSVGALASATTLPEPVEHREWVQADLRLAPGNSGGPLVDGAGRLVGLNTMIVGALALAVPLATIESFVHEALDRGLTL